MNPSEVTSRADTTPSMDWMALADSVLSGHATTRDEALDLMASNDDRLPEVLAAAWRIRHRYFGNTVQLYYLMNAKSGLCPEDCSYCSQSKVSTAEIPRYNLLDEEQVLEGARQAAERQAKTYCLVISARGPNEREMETVERLVPRIKEQYSLDVCACLGLLTREQARRLQACGVDRVNHNLNTSEKFYPEICSTHTFQDRIETLEAVREAGMELCSGGILGMGESFEDAVDMALALRDLEVDSIPVNFLHAIDGTPLAETRRLNPRDCLRALCMVRFTNPQCELRIAGGREIHLRELQPMGLYPANSLFVGDYLTTRGQEPVADFAMIEAMGFEVTQK